MTVKDNIQFKKYIKLYVVLFIVGCVIIGLVLLFVIRAVFSYISTISKDDIKNLESKVQTLEQKVQVDTTHIDTLKKEVTDVQSAVKTILQN